jgi:hypothetical protein
MTKIWMENDIFDGEGGKVNKKKRVEILWRSN